MNRIGQSRWTAPQTLAPIDPIAVSVRDEATTLCRQLSEPGGLDRYDRGLEELAGRDGGSVIEFSNTDMVVRDGFGVLFVGQSGVGKTTLAKAFRKFYEASWVASDHVQLIKAGGSLVGGPNPRSLFIPEDIDPPESGVISAVVFVANGEHLPYGRAYETLREAADDNFYARLFGEEVGYDLPSLHVITLPVSHDFMTRINLATLMSMLPFDMPGADFGGGATTPLPEKLSAMSAAILQRITELSEQHG